MSKCSFEEALQLSLDEYQAKYIRDGAESIKHAKKVPMELDEDTLLASDNDSIDELLHKVNISGTSTKKERKRISAPNCSGSSAASSSDQIVTNSNVNWRLLPENAIADRPRLMPPLALKQAQSRNYRNQNHRYQNNRNRNMGNRNFYNNRNITSGGIHNRLGSNPNNPNNGQQNRQRNRQNFQNYFGTQKQYMQRSAPPQNGRRPCISTDPNKSIIIGPNPFGTNKTIQDIIDLRQTPPNASNLIHQFLVQQNPSTQATNAIQSSALVPANQPQYSSNEMSSLADQLLLKFDKFHDLAQSMKVAEERKKRYNLPVQKEIANIQNRPLMINCETAAVVTYDGPGINGCQPVPQSTPVSMNIRFA